MKAKLLTFVRGLQTGTPPRFQSYLKSLTLLLVMMVGVGNVWGGNDPVVCTFSSKAWAADNGGKWTSGKDGAQLSSGRGVQVTTTASGANGTSGDSFTSVSQVVVTYSTNASSGAGSIAVKVGDTDFTTKSNVTKTGGTTDRTLTFTGSATGKVKITVTCSTNSIYVKSVAISTGGSGPATPTLDVDGGTFAETKTVKVSNYSSYESGTSLFYTLDGNTPTAASTAYDDNTGIAINKTCTLKVIAIKGEDKSTVKSAVYTINVFNSLEALAAADITSGTTVKVSFENKAIKSIYTSSQNKRTGIYFDIQKGNYDIEIYYSSEEVPSDWVAGGVVSGTMTCPWTKYNNTWELAPTSGWSWNNMTYTAPKQNPKVTFNTNGGTINSGNITEYVEGTGATLPTDVTKLGYDFCGWFTNSELTGTAVTVIGTTETGDKEYWAKWQVKSYTLTWTLNDGVPQGTAGTDYTAAGSVQYGATLTAPVLTKTGHSYVWNPEVLSTMPANDATYEAVWTPKSYTITYRDKDNADFSGTSWKSTQPTTHTYGTATTLVEPIKANYTFDGWFTASDCSGSAITELGATAFTDNITLYAKWTENAKYTITFVDNLQGTQSIPGTTDNKISVYYGETFTFPSITDKTVQTTGTCEDVHYHFMGWVISTHAGTIAAGDIKTGTSDAVKAEATYHAVWAKESDQ